MKPGSFGLRYTLRDHRGAVVWPARQTWREWLREFPRVFWSLHWGVKVFLLLYSAITLELIWIAILGSRLALDGFRTTSSFAWHMVALVSVVLLLGAIKPALFFWAIGCLYWRPTVAWRRLQQQRCPSCLYPLDRDLADADECVTCPECGAGWMMREVDEAMPPAKWRFVPRQVRAAHWWSAMRVLDDRGAPREYIDPGTKVKKEARRKIWYRGTLGYLALPVILIVLLFLLLPLYESLDSRVPILKLREGDDAFTFLLRLLGRGAVGLPFLLIMTGYVAWLLRVMNPLSVARARLACGLCGACGTETVASGEAGVRVCPRCEGAWKLRDIPAAS